MSGGAAGRVLLNGVGKGSGFAIAERRVLTAGHVVRDAVTGAGGRGGPDGGPLLVCVVDRGEPAEVPGVVEYQPEDGEPVRATRVEISTGLDVAVLHLAQVAPAVLPAAGQAAAGAAWRVETRPGRSGSYTLTGTVTDPHRRVQNEGGRESTLIQLLVEQQVGDHQGYSGSPVIAAQAGGVVGVLVEQGRWRVSPQLGQPPPVANVLFAAPIDRVLAEFDLPGARAARPAGAIPEAVAFEVRRPELLDRVIGALAGPSPAGRLVGLAGMGGAGKSVLAAAAARDPKVREAFPDGRFWLELGLDPPLLQLQASLAAALGSSTPVTDVPQGRALLSRLLGERRCLLVLDNVWDQAGLSAFTVTGPAGRVLATTRDAATLPGATVVPLGELAAQPAMQLLAGWAATSPGDLPEEAAQVAAECGYLPLALALCGAMISDGSHTWPQLLGLLRGASLDELRSRLIDYPHPSLAVALGASLATLPPQARDRYRRLAVFDGQGPIPPAALQVLWGLGQPHTTALTGDLASKSLLRQAADGRVSVHDLQMDYLTRLAPSLPALHNQLLAAYRGQCPSGWPSGPDDGYFYQHLAHHLQQAGQTQELQALLLDPDWMHSKLVTGTVSGLLTDYNTLPTDPTLRLAAGALQLSAHILSSDPGQLPGQLCGRLTSQTDPQLHKLLQRTRHWPAPWLRPLTASLIPPGGPLQRTLTGHDSPVLALAVSADGRRAVSRGEDGKARVWDLDAGELRHTLTGHEGGVPAVAVSADGRRAVSNEGAAVRVWDLDAGTLLHTLDDDYWAAVEAVAVSADGGRAVSASDDGTVRVWDLRVGTLLHETTTRYLWTTPAAVSADVRRAVSSGSFGVVLVWDREDGTLQHTMTSDDGQKATTAIAVSADGRWAVSGSADGTVRVWDLEAGILRHILTGHDGPVRTVAVSADGRRAASGGDDETVRVWDLDAVEVQPTLSGHDQQVGAVAVSADARRAVSASDDRTVRVWDLEAGTLLHTLSGPPHNPVWTVAVSADGRRVVSGGSLAYIRVWDVVTGKRIASAGERVASALQRPNLHWMLLRRTDLLGWLLDREVFSVSADGRVAVSGGHGTAVRVWDLNTGEVRTLTGHDGKVDAVAITADGRRAVSGSEDGTVAVWDVDAGTRLHTLTGHARQVRAVAVSPDGRHAVSGGEDATVRMWDLTQGVEVASFTSDSSITVIAATTSGMRAVVGTVGGFVHLLELCGHE